MARRTWSNDEILEALRADAERRGRAPLVREWSRKGEGRPTANLVMIRFGSWPAAIEAAGLSQVPVKKWTKDRILDALRADAEKRGKAPSSHEWDRAAPDRPTRAVVIREFGTWAKALQAAGLDHTRNRTVWTDEQILEALRSDAERLGRTPTYGDWRRSSPDHPSAQVVAHRFGSWAKAISAAGVHTLRDREPALR